MILLSFDAEEFDLPSEHRVNMSLDEQMVYSKEGTRIILDLLKKYQIKATFFCTAVFAINARELIREIINMGHEVASHGYSHSSFKESDLILSKQVLESISGNQVNGFRMARMMKTDEESVAKAGYLYDSSINPTLIPGRYNNLRKSHTCFFDRGVLQIPASVTPIVRIPLFWLTMHNFPFNFYTYLCRQTLKKDGYLNIYFHTWELSPDLHDKRLRLPYIVRRKSGNELFWRLERLIQLLTNQGETFLTFGDFIKVYKNFDK